MNNHPFFPSNHHVIHQTPIDGHRAANFPQISPRWKLFSAKKACTKTAAQGLPWRKNPAGKASKNWDLHEFNGAFMGITVMVILVGFDDDWMVIEWDLMVLNSDLNGIDT